MSHETEMFTLFEVNGIMLYVDPDGRALGYEDVVEDHDVPDPLPGLRPERGLRGPVHSLITHR